MRIYPEYDEYKRKYHIAQEKYNKLINEKEQLFEMTQPGAIVTDKEITSCTGKHASPFDNYLIVKDKKKIDERIEEARSILHDRQLLLKLKEEELRLSKDWHDKIYIYYFIDHLTIRQIEKRIPYSRSEIHRKLEKIRENLK